MQRPQVAAQKPLAAAMVGSEGDVREESQHLPQLFSCAQVEVPGRGRGVGGWGVSASAGRLRRLGGDW